MTGVYLDIGRVLHLKEQVKLMTALQATSAGVRDMADGSLRITMEFDPRYAKEAYALFGIRGTPVAIAALTQQAAQEQAQNETIAEQKGGALAKLAGMWCNKCMDGFYVFIRPVYDKTMGGSGEGWGDVMPDEVGGPVGYCRHAILVICGIKSRAELDHNPEAARIFNERIRQPYMAWLQGVR